jgi:Protein of unknown function (DUF1592)/Protein of unknown function (DUF1588)/Protein of unknown function (DUF1595)/Protein of unknown function (DUF1587)/Protein of unknown function (DUF1585)
MAFFESQLRPFWAVAVLSLGCSGEVGEGTFDASQVGNEPGSGGSAGAAAPGRGGRSGNGSGGSVGAGAPSDPPSGAGAPPVLPSDTSKLTRVARLTHEQYANSVNELFGISDGPSNEFAPDALNGFPFDTSVDYQVDARLGPQYRSAAEKLAERAVTDDAIYGRLVACDPAAASCSGEFIASFGERAFRRPLSAAEGERFHALFARGQALVASGDAFRDGVRLVVEAMLQSPQFLYRVELGNQPGADGWIALDGWELASRLSFLIWSSMPDAELFTAARGGALQDPAEVDRTVRRLLADPRATRKLVGFHEQAWQFGRFAKIAPDRRAYPDAPSELPTRVGDASRRFIEEVLGTGGGFEQFLTAPYAFADAELARLYGKTGNGGLERIEFQNAERQGFLMQVGFLASNAYAVKTDPIHRGLFVLRDLLCRSIGDPPAGATMTPPPPGPEPKTTREEVSRLTEQSGCGACHALINPPGFAFEGFDALGQVRSDENGNPLDTSGKLSLDGAEVSFADARQLVQALATSQEARACYARKWLSFAYGHELGATDEATVQGLAEMPRSVVELVASIGVSPAMLKRFPNEVAP